MSDLEFIKENWERLTESQKQILAIVGVTKDIKNE